MIRIRPSFIALAVLGASLSTAQETVQAQTPQPAPQPGRAIAIPAPVALRVAPENDARGPRSNVEIALKLTDNQGLVREVRVIVTDRDNGSVRQGVDTPILLGAEKGVTYRTVGLNVDARPVIEESRVRLFLAIEGSVISKADPERPSFYTLKQQLNLMIRDGQTVEASRSSDPGGERSFTISVTARIIR